MSNAQSRKMNAQEHVEASRARENFDDPYTPRSTDEKIEVIKADLHARYTNNKKPDLPAGVRHCAVCDKLLPEGLARFCSGKCLTEHDK